MHYHNNYTNNIIITFEILMILLSFLLLNNINTNNKQLYQIEEAEHQMIELALRLKKSSHDLTQYARAYVVTGNKDFKNKYFKILDIRDGKQPRPINYSDDYWDLHLTENSQEKKFGTSFSLRNELYSHSFSQMELEQLKRSEDHSNKLAEIEKKAFKLYELNTTSSQKEAINLLYSNDYFIAKQKIVYPIHEFMSTINKRTQSILKNFQNRSDLYLYLFIVFLIFFILVNLYIGYYLNIKDKLLFTDQLIAQRQLIIENDKNNAIFNLQKAIIIVRNDLNMSKANSAFFNTFDFINIKDFLSKHDCICELFIEKEGVPHLTPLMNGLSWVEHIKKYPTKVHEAYMLDKHNRERIFTVEIKENVYADKTMVVFTDITEIRNQYHTFQRLFETSADGLLIMKNRKFIAVNDTLVKMLNYKNKSEILNLSPLALLPIFKEEGQRSKNGYKYLMRKCLAEGSSSLEGIHKKATGEEFWCDIAMTKIKIKQEDAIYIRWRDIDEFKKLQFSLEEQVQQQSKALIAHSRLAGIGEMMENITHQWKQPLSIILNLLSLLKLELKENKNLNIIEDQTKYLNKTIADFSSFSSSSENEKIYFDLKKSIQTTLNIFEFQANTYNIRVHTNINTTANIQGEIGQFNQALLVILSNAKDALIEHRTTEREIRISTKENSNSIILTIADNGKGIPIEIIDKIFEPYFTTKFKDKGTGIGLSMTYNIIKKSKGEIKVHSNAEGAVFTITLPKLNIKETS
ncbi:HAMP domain-containing histidine kinase [bacterium]|nr:HAMP domain-containing histidine kinase [bacterium]MBU1958074.1 HAMP domain-containing histidine kinase [bacterium]